MTKGLCKYTRHPNYFGNTTVWFSFGLFFIASGFWWPLVSVLLMTFILLKVSGVAMLERSLKEKPGLVSYQKQTSAFIPMKPEKS